MMTKNNFLKSTPIFPAFLVMGFGDVSGPLYGLYIASRTSKA